MKAVKQEIRAEYKKKRRSIPAETKQRYDRAIRERIEALPCYRRAACLLCYVSLSDEVDTFGLIEDALAEGKMVCVPVSLEETHTVDFYQINSLDELEPGTYGVLEPVPGKAKKITAFPRPAVCIVPGLVFDQEGFRLGYGKGYYDRFLQRFRGVKIGVCYRELMVELLPHGYYDRPVDWLVSEGSAKRLTHDERMMRRGGQQKAGPGRRYRAGGRSAGNSSGTGKQ